MEALSAIHEVPSAEVTPVRDDDRETLAEIKTLLDARKRAGDDNARTALGAVLEQGKDIGELRGALVELRQDAVNARIETNDALRAMAERLGEIRGMRWYERTLQVVMWLGLGGWAWLQIAREVLGTVAR